jgi:hypothetical protein
MHRDHAYVCNGKNNLRHNRHQLFGAGLQQILYLAGFKPIRDANVVCIGPNNEALRPADILANGDRCGHQVCIDVTLVSNMCENYPKPYVVGKAVLDADIRKNKKHSEACEKAGYGFQAFASDTSGVLSPDSYTFLCRLATSYAAITNRPYAYALSLCLRRVSFAIQKGLALQLTSSPAFIPTTIEDVFEIT